jgi:hypothetical protein
MYLHYRYYNSKSRKIEFKNRPVLVIGKADSSDYVILPISRVTNQVNLNRYYDVLLETTEVPLMNLKCNSYVRSHKQSVVHEGELIKEIVDFKDEYANTYKLIIDKMEEFQKRMTERARK